MHTVRSINAFVHPATARHGRNLYLRTGSLVTPLRRVYRARMKASNLQIFVQINRRYGWVTVPPEAEFVVC